MTYQAQPGKITPTLFGCRYLAEIRRVSGDGASSHHKWWVGPADQLGSYIAALNAGSS